MKNFQYNNFMKLLKELNRHAKNNFDNKINISEKNLLHYFLMNINDILIMVKFLNNNFKSLVISKPNIFIRLHPTISKKCNKRINKIKCL